VIIIERTESKDDEVHQSGPSERWPVQITFPSGRIYRKGFRCGLPLVVADRGRGKCVGFVLFPFFFSFRLTSIPLLLNPFSTPLHSFSSHITVSVITPPFFWFWFPTHALSNFIRYAAGRHNAHARLPQAQNILL
jgi:hypothetical protein